MGSEAVKVVVRCRPLNGREKGLGCRTVVSMEVRHSQCFIQKPGASDEPPKQFTFDGAYFTEQTTEQMYNEIAYSLVEGVTEGYNGTIFAYGQTGSGKSYTMQGVTEPAAQKGVIPRAFDHIFESIQIYNEEVRDLLGSDPKQKMELKEHPERGVYVRELSLHAVHSVGECERVMEQGWRNRSVGYTLMNKDSSHEESGGDRLRAGKLNLVDLAGSERQSKTGATGERLREATKINLSLSALGNVISALVDGRSRHVPYRDSKLTRLLQDSLGGNTRTLMVACLSPADNNYEESLSTLRYADRAKSIRNQPRVNQDPKDALLRQYRLEIQTLRALLADGQRDHLLAGSTAEPARLDSRTADSRATEAEKENIKQEYEEKLCRLQAEYSAEQQSKARLQDDIAALCSAYDAKLANVEKASSNNSEKSMRQAQEQCAPRSPEEPAKGSSAVGAQAEVEEVGRGDPSTSPQPGPGPLDHRHVLERNPELQQRHRQRKRLADQRKLQLIQALGESSEEGDSVMLRVYDSIQDEVHAKGQLLKAAKLEIRDLQAEFETERNDYLATIRRLEREALLHTGLLERMAPLVRRDCNYSNPDRLRKESSWDEDTGTWRLPDVVVQKTTLPSAVASLPPRITMRRVEEDRYKALLNRSNSENIASNYFKSTRASQLLGGETTQALGEHMRFYPNPRWSFLFCRFFPAAARSSPPAGRMGHMTVAGDGSVGPGAGPEVITPRPFRLESLDTLAPNGSKVKRRRSRTHTPFDGN
ncbi:hypothetical protein NHX12_030276 [Muraenolepis orangiensis]|uniref:Kinesin-like protein n=1 Tax=Muraenolepis orangiensis TaxID=630683 RepID=A0A9Q0EBE9_9TELE|nr:hypothetical protein NHX12_030276 [Muraenolepis orangiensis]